MKDKKICCFTGHRHIDDRHIVKLPEQIDILLDSLIAEGFSHFRAGGAVGFDTLCALKVLEKKKVDPDITLELCLPCRDQTKGWSEREKHVYAYVLERADSVSYADESYKRGCMHKRNRMLVDGSDACVAFCASSRGGTAYTCSYALSKGVRLINIYDKIGK